jgi:hypothetical protein
MDSRFRGNDIPKNNCGYALVTNKVPSQPTYG